MTETTVKVGSAAAGPTLTGSNGEALLQALRNLWPILGKQGRKQAINTALKIERENLKIED